MERKRVSSRVKRVLFNGGSNLYSNLQCTTYTIIQLYILTVQLRLQKHTRTLLYWANFHRIHETTTILFPSMYNYPKSNILFSFFFFYSFFYAFLVFVFAFDIYT